MTRHFAAIAVLGMCVAVSLAAQQAPALKIVVIEGEGGVNIIQQKTAVRPLVEVRDRNNLPVAGASVTFTIGGGGQSAAFAGGAQTLTVTTNAAGQAAASGLNAISSGVFQIQVSAAYQGQIATAAISPTNVATAAAAAQAGAGAGAGGSGGGISGTTIAIAGAAVGGAAVAATQLTGGGGSGNSGSSDTSYSGSFSGQQVVTTTTQSPSGTSACVSTRPHLGTLKITLRSGNATGRLETTGSRSESSVTGPNCSPQTGSLQLATNSDVTGGPNDLTSTFSSTGTGPTPNGGGSVTVTETTAFKGSLSGNTITGTLTFEQTTNGNNVFGGVSSTITGGGSVSVPVTLQKQ